MRRRGRVPTRVVSSYLSVGAAFLNGTPERAAAASHANICSSRRKAPDTADFQRALTTGNLQLIEAAAAELPSVSLEDALVILIVLAQRGDPRFERAAALGNSRVTSTMPMGGGEARVALDPRRAGLAEHGA